MSANQDALLKVSHLWKSFGNVQAAKDVSFEVPKGKMISLLGPSGCGKTTTLRCIAGLESPSEGKIVIGGVTVTDVAGDIHIPPEKRSIGMVFQSYAIWPHMTVFANVAFPLKLRKKESTATIEEKVAKTLKLVGLTDFADRPATNLSGGQQQRVALARALVAEPELVLFDEPLSNLDAKLREYMRVELIALQKRLGFTAVYVTHDQHEALALSDQLIIMNDGWTVQIGTPLEIYNSPRTSFVADFIGGSNLMKGKIIGPKGDRNVLVELEEVGTQLTCGILRETKAAVQGTPVTVSFRPERTGIVAQTYAESSMPEGKEINKMSGKVEAVLYLGEFFEYIVKIGGLRLKARSGSTPPIPIDTPVFLSIAPENCLALSDG
jgi:iron(III) transport system ATP-binding protein